MSLDPAVMARKLTFLKQYLADLRPYSALGHAQRLEHHYVLERLLQLLCESSADIALQICKDRALGVPDSYKAIFRCLGQRRLMDPDLAHALAEHCGMRNVIVHVYDGIDLDRIAHAVEPALEHYQRFLAWAVEYLKEGEEA